MGKLNTGSALKKVGEFYAAKIAEEKIDFDLLFGPAYKGIPIVSTTAIALSEKLKKEVPFAFNRKEVKDHGEGGWCVGAPLQGKVLLLDDVITAGTAIKQVIDLFKNEKEAHLQDVLIALDRQEKGATNLTAIQELEFNHQLKVHSIVTLNNLFEFLHLEGSKYEKVLSIMMRYKQDNE